MEAALSMMNGGAMSAVAKLTGQKQQLLARLEAEPGPNERAEIQALLAKIETALRLLDPEANASAAGE